MISQIPGVLGFVRSLQIYATKGRKRGDKDPERIEISGLKERQKMAFIYGCHRRFIFLPIHIFRQGVGLGCKYPLMALNEFSSGFDESILHAVRLTM